jgi:MFS family permease
MGFYMLVFFGGTPIGAPLLGILADHAGARWTLAIGGLGVMALTVLFAAVLWKPAALAAARSRHDTDLADAPQPASVSLPKAKSVTSTL